jgi:hypothetical protein
VIWSATFSTIRLPWLYLDDAAKIRSGFPSTLQIVVERSLDVGFQRLNCNDAISATKLRTTVRTS